MKTSLNDCILQINSTEAIIVNIYQLFLLSAMKFHVYMKEMRIKRLTQSLVNFQFSESRSPPCSNCITCCQVPSLSCLIIVINWAKLCHMRWVELLAILTKHSLNLCYVTINIVLGISPWNQLQEFPVVCKCCW